MLTLTTLASGSSGNSTLVSCGDVHILIDAGISARRITTALKSMGIDPMDLSAVLITHEHSDHISGLATLTRQLPAAVWASRGTAGELCRRIPALEGERLHTFEPGERFCVGALEVETFPTPHDTVQSNGYAVSCGGRKAAVVTDLGHVTEAVRAAVLGSHLLLSETNHDEDWVRTGPYPYFLKSRILGDYGHLSNRTGAALICSAVEAGARQILLGHLSDKNNTPELAYETVSGELNAMGARPGRDVGLAVAPRSGLGERYIV